MYKKIIILAVALCPLLALPALAQSSADPSVAPVVSERTATNNPPRITVVPAAPAKKYHNNCPGSR